MKWAIREKIGAGFGVALLILVLIGVVSYRSTAQLIETGRLVSQTHELLGMLESVRARMTEIEAGARGYVITGDDRYLEPYYAARAEIDQDIKDLGQLVADNRDQQEYFETLAALIAERMGLSMAMVDLRQQEEGEPARQLVLMDRGKLVMDTIRVVITAVENDGEALLRQRDEEAHQRAHYTTVTIVVGSLLALTLVAVATVIINRDITGLQRTEEALRKSEELYHTLVKNFPNGWVLLFDHDLRYTIADGAGLAAISLSKEAFEGKTIWEALPPETCALIEPHYRAALTGEARSFELLYANRAHLVYTLPIRNEFGQIYAGMMMSQDITQRKEVERLKDEFLSTVSHELRTPLSSLRGFAELLLEREFPPDRRQRFVSIIHSETVRLTNLINDFLDLQRIESGRQEYHFERVDMRELLREGIALFTSAEAQLIWHLEVPDTLSAVQADKDRIRQVLSNLLSNAIKFSPRGGEVTVGTREQGPYVEVWMRDQGIGIPSEAMPRLFSKFFRVDNSQTRHIPGTGLGLALVKEIVEAHQGRVWADSEPNRGSTFYFTLPVAEQPLPAVVVPESLQGGATDILLVENDPVFAQLLRERFEGAGLSMTATSYAEQALELTRLSPPRLLLVDIHLAGAMDGWDLLVALKSDPVLQAIPIILITTSAEANLRGLALAGADYLPRPVSTDGLRQAIQRQLPSLSGKRVLVADDDQAFRRQVVELLAAEPNIQVAEASHGREVLRQVAQRVPDLLLLDLLMPDMDGFEVLHRLRADKRALNLPVLVVTSKDLLPDEKAHIKRKMASLVSKKEASLDHFARIVGRVLGS
jgi:signal transduction histidine kinase/CHASE3 domain sensor protein/DNA-binding response OmpR family regulator